MESSPPNDDDERFIRQGSLIRHNNAAEVVETIEDLVLKNRDLSREFRQLKDTLESVKIKYQEALLDQEILAVSAQTELAKLKLALKGRPASAGECEALRATINELSEWHARDQAKLTSLGIELQNKTSQIELTEKSLTASAHSLRDASAVCGTLKDICDVDDEIFRHLKKISEKSEAHLIELRAQSDKFREEIGSTLGTLIEAHKTLQARVQSVEADLSVKNEKLTELKTLIGPHWEKESLRRKEEPVVPVPLFNLSLALAGVRALYSSIPTSLSDGTNDIVRWSDAREALQALSTIEICLAHLLDQMVLPWLTAPVSPDKMVIRWITQTATDMITLIGSDVIMDIGKSLAHFSETLSSAILQSQNPRCADTLRLMQDFENAKTEYTVSNKELTPVSGYLSQALQCTSQTVEVIQILHERGRDCDELIQSTSNMVSAMRRPSCSDPWNLLNVTETDIQIKMLQSSNNDLSNLFQQVSETAASILVDHNVDRVEQLPKLLNECATRFTSSFAEMKVRFAVRREFVTTSSPSVLPAQVELHKEQQSQMAGKSGSLLEHEERRRFELMELELTK